MNSKHVLLVEDNEGDIMLTTEALEESKQVVNSISVVRNGKLALDFIFKKGEYKNVPSPDLILLDINLPLKNGIEVLEIVKSDKITKKIPIIMFTTSSSKNDIVNAYSSCANAYVTKPLDVEEFNQAIGSIVGFWINIVQLP